MSALMHVDLGAAAHLGAGAQASRVQEHYGRAVKMMPGLEAHLVLGTMGTYNWYRKKRKKRLLCSTCTRALNFERIFCFLAGARMHA